METKKCSKCGEVKALDEFGKSGEYIRGACKVCSRPSKEASRKKSKKWAMKNPDKVKAMSAAYIAKLPAGETSRRMKKYRADNPGKAKHDRAIHYAKNAGTIKAAKAQKRYELSDAYVANTMRLRISDCSPELIAIQRENIQIIRLTKQLNQAIKDAQK